MPYIYAVDKLLLRYKYLLVHEGYVIASVDFQINLWFAGNVLLTPDEHSVSDCTRYLCLIPDPPYAPSPRCNVGLQLRPLRGPGLDRYRSPKAQSRISAFRHQ